MDGVAFPGDAGAVVPEQHLGLVERGPGLLPPAEHQAADAPDHVDHAPGLGRVQAVRRRALRGLEQRLDASGACRFPAVERWAASMASARATRKGSPARRASSRPRVWKSAPRMGSMTLSPATADQQRSMRVRSSAETWVSSRARNFRPRSRSRARCRISDDEGPPGRRGHAQPQRAEDGPQERQPLVHVAADEELGRGQPGQLQGLRGGASLAAWR